MAAPSLSQRAGKGVCRMGWGPLGDIVDGVKDTVSDGAGLIADKASDAAGFVADKVSDGAGWVSDHWKTIAEIGAGILVTAAILAVVVASGGTLAPFALAGAAALLGAGAAGGVASWAVGNWLNDRPFTWKGALTSAVLGAVLTWATPAAGKIVSPAIERVAGQTAANVVRTLTGASAGARPNAGSLAGSGSVADDVVRTADDVLRSADDALPGALPDQPLTAGNGAARAAQFGEHWQSLSLDDAVSRLGSPDELVAKVSESGQKIVFTNTRTGQSVVYDPQGNYFRLQDANGVYLGADGLPVTNKVPVLGPDGKPVLNAKGQPKMQQLSGEAYKSHFNGSTHFANTGDANASVVLGQRYGLPATSTSDTTTAAAGGTTAASYAPIAGPSTTSGFLGAFSSER